MKFQIDLNNLTYILMDHTERLYLKLGYVEITILHRRKHQYLIQ